jgi:nickel transport protein
MTAARRAPPGFARAALLAAALLCAAPEPAAAHRLKAFATVAEGAVSGYGFLVGGGRAAGAAVTATGPDGAPLWRGVADAEGAFRFPAPPAGPVAVTIDAGDGHAARITLPADRFGPAAALAPDPAGPPRPAAPHTAAPAAPDRAAPAADDPAAPAADDPAALAATDPAALAPALEAAVAAAVAREVRPLHEALAAAEARVRFNDVAGGVGMILGMGGAALWVLSRRPRP